MPFRRKKSTPPPHTTVNASAPVKLTMAMELTQRLEPDIDGGMEMQLSYGQVFNQVFGESAGRFKSRLHRIVPAGQDVYIDRYWELKAQYNEGALDSEDLAARLKRLRDGLLENETRRARFPEDFSP